MTERPTLAIGLMSGTSLDGMDAALVRLEGPTHATLLQFVTRPYSGEERGQIRNALNGATAAELARLHVRVAEWAADAVQAVLTASGVVASEISLIAFHGQTVWHEPPLVSWQLGEPAVLAERFGVRVVSGFRARDVAAGGQGAPLVPMADLLLFAAPDAPRILLNLGGMANLTFVQRRAQEDGVLAFDTGPGVAIIDATARLVDPATDFDRDGRIATQGRIKLAVLDELLADP
ncbi:MAG TPA: anhydro-N-acetylmuramic acid kinase, partial [Gemmatimonadales bacterium]|nr:anhydro-N-acetylmuramic acid kinase [Gemmatimonadales bacterium]